MPDIMSSTCSSTDLKLQEGYIEETMKIFESKAILHGGFGIVNVGGAWRSEIIQDDGIKKRHSIKQKYNILGMT